MPRKKRRRGDARPSAATRAAKREAKAERQRTRGEAELRRVLLPHDIGAADMRVEERLPNGAVRLRRAADGAEFELRERAPRDGAPYRHVRRRTVSPLDSYRARGLITRSQYQSGKRLRTDFVKAGFERAITPRYEPSAGGGADVFDVPEAAADARRDVTAALAELPLPTRDIVRLICCYEQSAAAAAQEAGLHRVRGMHHLRAGLDRLATLYGQWRQIGR